MFRLETITGNIQSVSTAPTHIPRNLYEQFVIYKSGSNKRFYWFDTVNNEWNYTELTSIAEDGQSALTGDVTLSEGTDITLTQTGSDIEIASSHTNQDGIYIEMACGENIAQHDAVCLGSELDSTLTVSQESGSTTESISGISDGISSNYCRGQTFIAIGDYIHSVGVYAKELSGSGAYTFAIFATSSGLPTGSPLAEVSAGLTTSLGWRESDLSSPLAVTPGVTYALLLKGGAGDNFEWTYNTSGGYADGTFVERVPTESTWTSSSGDDFKFRIYESIWEDATVYKCDASYDAGVGKDFIGFARASATSGNLCSIQCGDTYTNPAGLSNLTTGATYYLSDTAGSIGSTAGTVSKKIGVAVSATKLQIKHDNN